MFSDMWGKRPMCPQNHFKKKVQKPKKNKNIKAFIMFSGLEGQNFFFCDFLRPHFQNKFP